MEKRNKLILIPIVLGSLLLAILTAAKFSALILSTPNLNTTPTSNLTTSIPKSSIPISTRPITSVQKQNLTLKERIAPLVSDKLKDYEVEIWDGAIFRANVEAGKTITLSFANLTFELKLTPHDLYAPSTTPHDVSTFKGKIVGNPNSSVRLSLRTNVVRGFIHTGGNDYWYIEPLKNFGDPASVDAPINTHVIYRLEDVIYN